MMQPGSKSNGQRVRASTLLKRANGSVFLLVALSLGCHTDMRDQHRNEGSEQNRFFADLRANRPLEAGVIARGQVESDSVLASGRQAGQLVAVSPVTPTRAVLVRGGERYEIYCSPCHSRTGDGNGMIVQRGYPRPPTFHSDILRQRPDGHFFDVITHGFGRMPSYRAQIPSADRWAIVAYLRALQWSQHADVERLSAADRSQLEESDHLEESTRGDESMRGDRRSTTDEEESDAGRP